MNNDERMSVSVPITGIDTSTPDAIVADGKCEKLHNLRFSGGSWRNVLESPDVEQTFSLDMPYKLAYQHPANKANSYIAVSTEQQYHLYEDTQNNRLLYLEPQEGSDLAKVYKKEGDNYVAVPDVIINYDESNKSFYSRAEQLVDNVGLFVDDGGVEYITIGKVPKVGNLLFRVDDNYLLTEKGPIVSVEKRGDVYYLQVDVYDIGLVDFDLTFSELTSATIPMPAIISTVPPNAVVSFDVERNAVKNTQVLCVYDPEQKFNVTHFGKTLFIQRPDLLTFILKDDKYSLVDFSRIIFRCEASEVAGTIDDSFVAKGIGLPSAIKSGTLSTLLEGDCVYYPLASKARDQFLFKQFEGDEWRGEICYFLAARMEDGAVVSVSPLFIAGNNPDANTPIVIQKYNGEKTFCLYKSIQRGGSSGIEWQNSNGNPTTEQLANIRTFGSNHPLVNFTVHSDNDNLLLHDIALYSTRILPTFDLSKLSGIDDYTWDNADTDQVEIAGTIFSDTTKNIANEPFYLVDTIAWSDYKEGRRSFDLKYSALEAATGNSIYEPNANIAPIIDFLTAKEYNNSMHFGGVTRTLPKGFVYRDEMIHSAGLPIPSANDLLFDGYTPNAPDDDRDYESDYDPGYDDGGYNDYVAYGMRTMALTKPIKDVVTRIVKSTKRYYAVAENINTYENQWYIDKILSYPDANADSMMFCTGLSVGDEGIEHKLSPINGINFSFHIPSGGYRKFNPEYQPTTIEERTPILKDIVPNTKLEEPHKLFVSATNNNFDIPFDQVYSIGSLGSRILAVNSATIEMSDAKFGEMPLYAFTDEGVFALQSGEGSILYSAIIPINYDKIINPNTLAINYNLIYITEEGVKAISSNKTTLISEAINDAENKPLLDYLREAELHNLKAYNELAIHNPGSDYAFIYSLNDSYWSTRDFKGVSLGGDKLYQYADGTRHYIFDLSKRESGEVVTATLKTRPIKFNSHEFKRLETFIPRLRAAGNVEITIRFYGSNDRVNWALMREVKTEADADLVIRRFPFSARYIYIEVDIEPIDVGAGFDISSMDMEYYLKFLRRMR